MKHSVVFVLAIMLTGCATLGDLAGGRDVERQLKGAVAEVCSIIGTTPAGEPVEIRVVLALIRVGCTAATANGELQHVTIPPVHKEAIEDAGMVSIGDRVFFRQIHVQPPRSRVGEDNGIASYGVVDCFTLALGENIRRCNRQKLPQSYNGDSYNYTTSLVRPVRWWNPATWKPPWRWGRDRKA